MKYTLTKLSQPCWERDFYDKQKLQRHLFLNICEQCRSEDSITEISTIADMLATACGCEFIYEEHE